MEDAPHVGVVHRLGRLGQQRGGGPRVVAVGGQPVGEAAAGDQLHGEVALAVVLADLVDRHDAGVVEQRDRLGLVLEPPQLVVAGQHAGPDHLEGDGPVEADLAGPVDDAHAAAAELGLDLVVAEVADGGPGRRATSASGSRESEVDGFAADRPGRPSAWRGSAAVSPARSGHRRPIRGLIGGIAGAGQGRAEQAGRAEAAGGVVGQLATAARAGSGLGHGGDTSVRCGCTRSR